MRTKKEWGPPGPEDESYLGGEYENIRCAANWERNLVLGEGKKGHLLKRPMYKWGKINVRTKLALLDPRVRRGGRGARGRKGLGVLG